MICNWYEAKKYKELVVWQRGIELVFEVYKIPRQSPTTEKYGLASQMQRAAIAIPSNIAEDAYRNHTTEFRQFLGIAYASSAELETQIIIAKRLYAKINYAKAESINLEVQKMLSGLTNKLL